MAVVEDVRTGGLAAGDELVPAAVSSAAGEEVGAALDVERVPSPTCDLRVARESCGQIAETISLIKMWVCGCV